MEVLLTDKLISHYNLSSPEITDWFINTEESYFEIEDTNAGEIQLHTVRGEGMAKFLNRDTLELTIINYDKFITSIRDEPFKNGRKRCDIIVSCNIDRYFILGELKDRNPQGNVRSVAKKQLLSSIQTLKSVPEINTYINSKAVKRSCYFNKQPTSPPFLTATTAFNRLSSVYPDGLKMSKPDIEELGFEFYEYTGEQTMNLTS